MISESEIHGPFVRTGGNPGVLATVYLAALGGGLTFGLVPVPAAWWVCAGLALGYTGFIWRFNPRGYVWVEGSTLRWSSRWRDVRVDLNRLAEVTRYFVPQLGALILTFVDQGGEGIEIVVRRDTEALRHEIGRHIDVSVWHRAKTDPRAVRELWP